VTQVGAPGTRTVRPVQCTWVGIFMPRDVTA
jgi:hypothetical protein